MDTTRAVLTNGRGGGYNNDANYSYCRVVQWQDNALWRRLPRFES